MCAPPENRTAAPTTGILGNGGKRKVATAAFYSPFPTPAIEIAVAPLPRPYGVSPALAPPGCRAGRNRREGRLNPPVTKFPSQARWREKNPLSRRAHVATASALKRGLIVRQPCELCGDPVTDSHHDDYLQPLNGRWLCRRHHKAEHCRLKTKEVAT